MPLVLYASEIAACAGMHKYRQPWEAAISIFRRNKPHDYEELAAGVVDGEAKDILQRVDPVDISCRLQDYGVTDEVESAVACGQEDLERAIDRIREKGSVAAGSPLDKQLQQYVFVRRGVEGEKEAVDAFSASEGVAVGDRNLKFHKKTFDCSPGKGRITIGGRIDGFTDDGRLIEVKTRQRKFFDHIPLYEKVQMLAYMKLVSVERCELVQRYGKETRSMVMELDDSLWERVLDRLYWFSMQMNAILRSKDLQVRLLTQRLMPDARREAAKSE
jgi:hypothetical protein